MSTTHSRQRQAAGLMGKLAMGLGSGFLGGAALAWWLARFQPLDGQDYASLQAPAAGESELLRSIDGARLQRNVEGLSNISNRRGGTPGEVAAREWVLQRFRQAGLSHVHLSPFIYPRWQRRARSELTLFTPAPYAPDFIVLNGSAATGESGLERRVIDVGRGSETDYTLRASRDLQDTIHLITQSQEPRRDLVLRATRNGASAAILAHPHPSPPGKPLIENGTAVSILGRIPALAISHETGQRLRGLLGKGQVRALMHINVGYSPGYAANVMGQIPGRTAEYVVLAAHYDAWYAGAADNAAGLAILLELARQWTQDRLRPRRTIRFISYAAEEEGLIGSLLDVITRAPLVKARCRGVITPDVVGVPQGALRFRASPPALAQIGANLAQEMGYSQATGYPISLDEGPTYSDHWPYAQLLLPAMVISKGPDPFYHTPYDTASRLDYEDLRWTAAIVGAMGLRLAER